MIIIKTNNGDVFVNENHMKVVRHNRKNRTVQLSEVSDVIGMYSARLNTIEDVEVVLYCNGETTTNWKDEGSFVKQLIERNDHDKAEKKWLNELARRYEDALRSLANEIFHIVKYHEGEIQPGIAERLLNNAGQAKDVFLTNLTAARQEYEERHKNDKNTDADIIAEQDKEIVKLKKHVRELETNAKAYQSRIEEIHSGNQREVRLIYGRNLWQRIINKKVQP